MKKLFLFAIVILGFSAVSFGQEFITKISDNTASANIITTLELLKGTSELDFGTIGSNIAEKEVVMAPDGTRDGTADLISTEEGSAAEFIIKGEPDYEVQVTLPVDGVVILDGAGDDMDVKTFTSDLSDASAVDLGSTGQVTFHVGATLVVNAGQDAGEYVGQYEVTVVYN